MTTKIKPSGLDSTLDFTFDDVSTNTVTVSTGIIANGTIGTTGQVLASNGTGSYWADANFAGGEAGDKGDKGDKGADGTIGVDGAKGDKGDLGAVEATVDAFTGNGSNTEFTLSTTPASENHTLIVINGVTQLKTEYTVVGTTLTFTEAIADGAQIEVTTFAGGAKGEPGEYAGKGDKGDTGLKGDGGAKGEKGQKGDTGDKGTIGDKGELGPQGIKGEKGTIGSDGAKGDAGADSTVAGPKGDKGEVGATGAKGDAGSIAASTYLVQGKKNDNQTISTGTDNVITFVDEYDDQNWWNTSTNRFTPTVQGYYQITLAVWWPLATGAVNQYNIQARKNGSGATISQTPTDINMGQSQTWTRTFYMNGTTDYIDFTAYNASAAPVDIQSSGTWFTATLIAYGKDGTKGDKGDAGASGSTGSKGDKGEIGTSGTKGDTGATGAKGEIGTSGTKGDKGDDGTVGADGTKGDKGDVGTTGSTGSKGDAGAAGAKGDKGDVEAQGNKGDKGDLGTKGDKGVGDKGDKGDPGVGGGGGSRYVTMSRTGTITSPFIDTARYYPPKAMDIINVQASLSVPSGSTFSFRINKNGTNTGVYSISSGEYRLASTNTTISLTTSDYLTIDVVSGTGSDMKVDLEYTFA